MPHWRTVLKILNKGSDGSYFLTHRHSWILSVFPVSCFPWHWSKVEEQEDKWCIWNAWDVTPFIFIFVPLLVSQRTWVGGLGLQKKRWRNRFFFFAIPKATTIKWMLTSREDLRDLLEPSHGLVAFVGQDGPCCQREPGVVALCIATAVWPQASHVPWTVVFLSEKCR